LTLSGMVDWHYQRVEPKYDLRKLSGVRGLVNEIEVAPKPRTTGVRAKILAALDRHAGVDAHRIAVDVSAGRVEQGERVGGTRRGPGRRLVRAWSGMAQPII